MPPELPAITHDAELDGLLGQVEAAGLVEQYVDDEGQPAMRLTPEGVRVARLLAMLGVDGQDALMAAVGGRWLKPRRSAEPGVFPLERGYIRKSRRDLRGGLV